ncbi:MAG: hypothetical protein KKF62_11455 [Bacteroidetes bacterium]|nr:hypothetical protein [Bacteroidota bacterium]MBU1116095.1 hypothetical protein [Bacteroidota bacterium]MBU1799481.1 hypothetical protein [Bacteroidota bacterium]
MENLPGIISLLIACIEIVLLINLVIFAKKNSENKIIIGLLTLLFGYQFMEFYMCYTHSYSNLLIYISFLIISFLPPLLLYLVLEIKKVESKFKYLVFLPIILLLIYYLFAINGFEITTCTILFVAYEMPLGDLYGVIYYTPVLLAIILLFMMVRNPIYQDKKLNLQIVLSGIVLTFVPVALIIIAFPFLIDYVESFFCKAASLIALTLTIYAMRNNNKINENNNE